MSERLWKVAVEAPLLDALTYKTAPNVELERGHAVKLPLGKSERLVRGVILGLADAPSGEFKLKAIDSREDEWPMLPDRHLQWLEWLARYYIYPIGHTTSLAYPPLKRLAQPRASRKAPVVPETEEIQTPPELTPEQKTVVEAIRDESGFGVHLVFGVTGSGKTEVYLRLLEKILAEGKTGLVIVPEISLTPQLTKRFAARFKDTVAVMHSQLTERERTNQWWDIVEGRKKILIGARSALFVPVPNLGVIIVDEEHEPSFKQDEKLKYHGRDAAIMLGRFSNCPVLLGSATPSLESWRNAQEGKYKLHTLTKRVGERHLPEIHIIDMRGDLNADLSAKKKTLNRPYWMSPILFEKLTETMEQGNQAAIFLNRRGVANMMLCKLCGHTLECPNCDIKLTLHAHSHLVCHYCDYHENLKEKCPECADGELEQVGIGTELIEDDLRRCFPERNIARADRDEIQSRQDMEELIQRMETGEIDILIGTQMIAKGLDFPKLKLVGLALADVGFNLPDFRATERSFQLITQMAGRSGRHIKPGEDPGQVLIQCFNTEHDSLTFSQQNNFIGFAEQEMRFREALRYPPYGRLIHFRVQSTERRTTQDTAFKLAQRAKTLKAQNLAYAEIELLGPAEAPLAKIRNMYRHQFLIKGARSDVLNSFARQIVGDESWIPARTRILIDVDPINML